MDDEADAPWEKHAEAALTKRSLRQGFLQLFEQSRGIYISCASSLGEYAYSFKSGHIYTAAFWRAVLKEASKRSPTWKGALERTIAKVRTYQNPYYEFHEYY